MINLSAFPKISQDLISSAVTVDYLLHIKIPNNDVYIATQKQTFDTGDGAVYWDDRDLNISSISEKINIDSKKIYISNISITLNNYKVSGSRVSDILGDGFGIMIDLYVKTPSCAVLTDCIKMANLRIIRLDHDDKKVKISAEDAAQQGFYIDLPRVQNVLTEDETFEFYVGKPVPILYGHLESAPATVYIDNYTSNTNIYENNSMVLLPDNSYLEDEIDIVGIKNFGANNLYAGMSPPSIVGSGLELVNNDIVQLSIGELACSVNCYPYYNTGYLIRAKCVGNNYSGYYPQYESNGDHVRLMSKYEGEDTLLKNQAMWTHSSSNLLSKQGIVLGCYSSTPSGSTTPAYYFYSHASEFGVTGDLLFGKPYVATNYPENLKTREVIYETEDDTGLFYDFTFWEHKIGVETLSFEPLSGSEPYEVIKGDGETTPYPTDIHFTGKVDLKLMGTWERYSPASSSDYARLWTIGYPSGVNLNEFYEHDPGTSAEDGGIGLGSSDIGFPSEVAADFEINHYDGVINSDHLDQNMLIGMLFADSNDEKGNYIFKNQYLFDSISIDGFSHDREVDAWTYNSSLNRLANMRDNAFPNSPFINNLHNKPEDSLGRNFNFLNSNEITFYYMWDAYAGANFNSNSQYPSASYSVRTNYRNAILRRSWAEADVFNKEFFLNARGRTGNDIQDDSYSFVNGVIEVKYEGEDPNPEGISVSLGEGNTIQPENSHLEALYYLLTNKDAHRKNVGDEAYGLMIMTEHSGENAFLYDIDLLDIKQTENLALSTEINQVNRVHNSDGGMDEISHAMGWSINFSAKTFGNFYTQTIGGVAYNILKSIKLVYGKKNYSYSGNQLIVSGVSILDEPGVEVDNFNSSNAVNENEWGSHLYLGYSTIYFNSYNEDNGSYLLENPAEVLKNLVQVEVSPSSSEFDNVKFSKALINNIGINFALSLNEVENSRDILENMCLQSKMMFRYRARDSKPIIETLKPTYSNADVVATIDPQNMLSFTFKKTNIEDLCTGGCIVKYGKNYITGELAKETPKKEFDEETLGIYKEYYHILDEKNHILEIEAPYIQDLPSAIKLRNYLFELNRNQHLTCKFNLSLRDGLAFEPGDIIDFSSNPLDVKPYGSSITEYSSKIDQPVYPFFMITSVSKKESNVTIEVYQLHELTSVTTPDITPEEEMQPTIIGDVTLDGEVNYHDRDLLLGYVMGLEVFSEQQLLNADINGDLNIDLFDVVAIEDLPNYDPEPEEQMIDDVFEALRQRLHPVLETVGLDLEQLDSLGDYFLYFENYDPITFSGANSYVDEEPYSDIAVEITGYKFTVSGTGGEIVQQEEGEVDTFVWDVSNLETVVTYKVSLNIIADAVEHGFNGEQRTLVSDSVEIEFTLYPSLDTGSVFVPVISVNGDPENYNTYHLITGASTVFSAEDSYFQFPDNTVDEVGGEVTGYQFHCTYLINNTNDFSALTPGNIIFNTGWQDSPIYERISGLTYPGKYIVFLWAQSPSGVDYGYNTGYVYLLKNVAILQVDNP